jgi:hypothetical protein
MSTGTAAKTNSLANIGAGQGIASTGTANAAGLYGTVAPALTQEAIAPQGINPADLAKMNTAAQQSAGGSNAGAVGQGSLLSARTRNAGSGAAAIAKSAEGAQQQLGNEAVGIQNENTKVKQQQQQAGLNGLQSLYGTTENAALGGLGASNQALGLEEKAPQSFWQKTGQQLGGTALNAALFGGGA